jgi:tRNA-5-methyluridine54 2-sulfurtransferase
MRCRSCRGSAVVEIRRHNAAFCADCFVRSFREQVRRAIRHYDMFSPGDRILVAVSGGKDSLALWETLLHLGYDASGLYLGLGIDDYSDRSGRVVHGFAESRDAELIHVDLRTAYGFDIPTAGRRGSRSTCAVCGLSKRYAFNRAALEGGFDVVATGHNLDDEAATLLGNTLRWQTGSMARQHPSLPARDGLVRKVKPLHRLSELETAAYAFLREIDYVVEECPLVAGNTQLRYKRAMNELESSSPGTKAQFFLGFLDRGAALFEGEDDAELRPCETCRQPTTGRFCAFCRARGQILRTPLDVRSGPPAAGTSEPKPAEPDGDDDRGAARELSDEVLPAEIYEGSPR